MQLTAHLPADQLAGSPAMDAVTLLPSRVTLLDRIAERAGTSAEAPASLVLIGLLRRDSIWPMPGSHLDRVGAALSADLRGTDWLARSGPTEFAVLLDGAAHDAETAANRLVATVAAAGVEGVTACVGIAGLAPDASPSEVHRRATLCLTAARSVGAGRVIRYSGGRR
ncbi:diguanylate cyclase [Modestobacter sp. L9-4]|jgi:GGDEF domain-containing protein|uniref:diguanylate cyclase domain-containing protein n=1 Tax=Modestobacter sp. L9-4 TaxID=2851567 RepID=UPI001C783FA2|nr:diguanylate cyclase [Modestobacter sp. L9-4]QXG74619.1 diguanylate cyclase [Modestobacter sp. L9-4]